MKNTILLSALAFLALITGCASTAPALMKYDLENEEKRLIKINPIENKTGDPKYDKLIASLTGKFINNIERSGKYKVIDARRKQKADSLFAPDSEAIASVTKINFLDNCLFGGIAWVNTPAVEVDMDIRIKDIDNGEILSTAAVTEKAWKEEWVAFYIFRIGGGKSQKQLESLALDYVLKALANKL